MLEPGAVRAGGMSLPTRVLTFNAAVLVGAFLIVALTPVTVSARVTAVEGAALAAIIAIALVSNVVGVQRTFAPLRRLEAVMRSIDPLEPGVRIDAGEAPRDVRALATAFNDMLERLEDERRESARRAVLAQEQERRRVARELHDELGQTLTGVLVQTDALARRPDPATIEDVREGARRSLEQVRRIARDLRPGTLEELGLISSLNALATSFTRQTGVHVERDLSTELPALPDDVEVVIYRVAQEALTNVVRHAGAQRVRLALALDGASVRLRVDDDGRGPGAHPGDGHGVTGMRERALLVHGQLTLAVHAPHGTRVTLEIPLGE